MALPCRITVYTEDGPTKVGTLLPTVLMGGFGGDYDTAFLEAVVRVEEVLAIITEAMTAD